MFKCFTQLSSNMEKNIRIPSCLSEKGPFRYLLPLSLSNSQTTIPVYIKNIMLPNHIPLLSGFKKIHMLLLTFSLTGTIIATPDSVYGIVKSTYIVLLYLIVMSPIAMSYLCIDINWLYLIVKWKVESTYYVIWTTSDSIMHSNLYLIKGKQLGPVYIFFGKERNKPFRIMSFQ